MEPVDELLKNKNLTFEDIDKLDYKQLNRGVKEDQFKPSDYLDVNDTNDSDDEILRKFRKASPGRRR